MSPDYGPTLLLSLSRTAAYIHPSYKQTEYR
jgi:hypothetical protein